MKIPEYVTKEEVKRVCQALNIRDWTTLAGPNVPLEEAEAILTAMEIDPASVVLEDFRQGLEVELEHGTLYMDTNVTNNHPLLTGRIVLAHFKESLDYYRRLDIAEIEGDLLKAVLANDPVKLEAKYRKLMQAKWIVSQAEVKQIR
jgi:hypothetical protein